MSGGVIFSFVWGSDIFDALVKNLIVVHTLSSHFLQKTMKTPQVKNANAKISTRVTRNLRPEFRYLKHILGNSLDAGFFV